MLEPKNHYEVLKVDPKADAATIKQAAQNAVNEAKKLYEAKTDKVRKAYAILVGQSGRDADANLRRKSYAVLGLEGKSDQATIKKAAQEVNQEAKNQYERRVNEVKNALAVLGDPDKRETYDLQLLEKQEREIRREKASKKAKLAKRRGESGRRAGAFVTFLKFIMVLLLLGALFIVYEMHRPTIHQWLDEIGVAPLLGIEVESN